MRKTSRTALKLAVMSLFCCLLVAGCGKNMPGPPTPTPTPTPSKTPAPPANGNIPSEQAKKLIAERSSEVIDALKSKDMKKLAGFVHPQLGVRFSPYTHVDTKKDLVFQADQLEKLLTDQTKRTWGQCDRLRRADHTAFCRLLWEVRLQP